MTRQGEQAMDRVIVTKAFLGICHMQVCAVEDSTDEEILRVCNKENPSGTTLGWCSVVRSDAKEPKRNPVACAQEPGRTHFLVAC